MCALNEVKGMSLFMSKKEEFKNFVRQHPVLLKHVQNGEMTWQKFFEIYDMYGEDNSAWQNYLTAPVSTKESFDFSNFFKGLDLDSIQNGVSSLQRVVGLLQDMSSNKTPTSEYKPRPIYKHFED